jgi:hypothetical protein
MEWSRQVSKFKNTGATSSLVSPWVVVVVGYWQGQDADEEKYSTLSLSKVSVMHTDSVHVSAACLHDPCFRILNQPDNSASAF